MQQTTMQTRDVLNDVDGGMEL